MTLKFQKKTMYQNNISCNSNDITDQNTVWAFGFTAIFYKNDATKKNKKKLVFKHEILI